MRYLYGLKEEFAPGAWRGLAVEDGLDYLLFGTTPDLAEVDFFANALVVAKQRFDRGTTGSTHPNLEKERDSIEGFLAQAKTAFGDRKPENRQKRIEIEVPGIEVPIIGFIDYLYDDSIADLKTTNRIPSKPRPDHLRQLAIYARATNRAPRLVYVSTKKSATYDVDDSAWGEVVQAAFALRSMLDLTSDAREALSLFAPEYTNFYWSDKSREAHRKAI